MAWESTRPSDTEEDFIAAKKAVRKSSLRRSDQVNKSTGYIYRGDKCIGNISHNQFLMMTVVNRYIGDKIINEYLPSFSLTAI